VGDAMRTMFLAYAVFIAAGLAFCIAVAVSSR
jgi:hypothetical protein